MKFGLDDLLEVAADGRIDNRRAINTWLRFWTACPVKRCRRWKVCAGDPARCYALFWPVVPAEVKAWLGAMNEAYRNGCSHRQADVMAAAAMRRSRSIQALEKRESER